MRARMALSISGADYEHREILLRNKPQAMLIASPKGTVPVLVLGGGRVIDESLDVMLWALAQNDPEDWLRAREDDLAFISAFEAGFKGNLDRYKYASRYDENLPRGAVDHSYRAKAVDALAPFEARLSDNPYLGGTARSLADIASFPFIRQFAAVEPDWWAEQPMGRVRDWLAGHIASDLFKGVMTKYDLWTPDSP